MFRAKLLVLIGSAAGVLAATTTLADAPLAAPAPADTAPAKAPPPAASAPAATTPAAAPQPRQYYSKFWAKNKGYYFKLYYYKPTPSAVTYRTQYVIYYSSKPQFYYYFNPYNRLYWGRYDRREGSFAKLPEAQRRAQVAELKEAAFSAPAAMPPIPESADMVPLAGPPADLPPDESDAVSPEKMKEILGKPAAKDPPPRQAYSGWCKQGGYYFSTYYHQPKAGGEYKSHRVIYYPPKGQYLFYYDPYTKRYWGRYDLEAKGYSLLARKDQGEKLAAIPESAYPKPGEMPPIPAADDDAKVAKPPTELPQ